MCGIAGWAFPEAGDTTARSEALARMTRALAHRGPDGEGAWAGEQVVLGHRRLKIIDLGDASRQPMAGPDGRFVLAYNGELYNFRELRHRLEGYPFRTDGDTEVLLAAWTKWGPACLDRLEGMFAFAVWDQQEKELFLARDRFGEKPLYHASVGGQLLFASEIRALLASGGVSRRLHGAALADHLRYGAVHGPATILEGVEMLLPGHLLHWAKGRVRISPWWQLADKVDPSGAKAATEVVHAEIRRRFFAAVEKRLVADVPFGAFLSGGIDSSAVVGAMARVASGPVRTFTVTFDESAYNEGKYAAVIAEKYRTRHTEIRLRPEQMLQWLPGILEDVDHPGTDGPNTWVVAKMTKEAGITMALSGLGGDEVFAGYPGFKRPSALHRARAFTRLPRPLRAGMGALLRKMKPGVAGWKAQELLGLPAWDVASTYPLNRLTCNQRQLTALLAGEAGPDTLAREVATLLNSGSGRQLPLLSQVSLAELTTYIPDVLLRDTDQMAMAHALEVRSPFLDHHLVGYVLGVADAMKYPHTPKQLLTRALGDLLPTDVVQRPKMGFTLPWDRWMRNELRPFCEERIIGLAGRPHFRREGVTALWQQFITGSPEVAPMRIWNLVALEQWLTLNAVD